MYPGATCQVAIRIASVGVGAQLNVGFALARLRSFAGWQTVKWGHPVPEEIPIHLRKNGQHEEGHHCPIDLGQHDDSAFKKPVSTSHFKTKPSMSSGPVAC